MLFALEAETERERQKIMRTLPRPMKLTKSQRERISLGWILPKQDSRGFMISRKRGFVFSGSAWYLKVSQSNT